MSSPSSSPSGNPSSPTESDNTEMARLRRDNLRLQKALSEKPGKGTRKRKIGKGSESGRTIRKCVHLYDSVSAAIAESDANEDPTRVLANEEERRKAARQLRSYHLLIKQVPGLEDKLKDPDFVDELEAYEEGLDHGGNGARNEDNHRIMCLVADWVATLFPHGERVFRDDRTGRGLGHDIYGALLVSATVHWSDPDVRAQLRDGEINLAGDYFSCCFYDGFLPNDDDYFDGYLKSVLLVATWSAIFKAPSSVKQMGLTALDFNINTINNEDDEPPLKKSRRSRKAAKTRSNVAAIIGMNGEVPARTIAYAAVMLHFNLTDQKGWEDSVYNFSYEGLYNYVVDYFEEPKNLAFKQQAADTLRWWNKQVFPTGSDSPDGQQMADNSDAIIQAQYERRLEKEAAAAEKLAAEKAEAEKAAAEAAAAAREGLA